MVAVKQDSKSRVDEMLTAVREFVVVYEDWSNDERTPDQPSLAFENALRHAADVVLNGDIPARCQELWVQVGRVKEEWNQYARGERDRRMRPLPRFWAAFNSMRTAMEQSVRQEPKRPEPVSSLLAQKVGYEQIAFHIYGHRGKGPLVTSAGQPDIAKIHQEADDPGSVIPESWIHPLQAEMLSDSIVRREHSVDGVMNTAGEEVKVAIIDPASIESLLREGQFPDVIAKVKAVPLSKVLAEAKLLGIKPNVRPNFGGADLHEESPEENRVESHESTVPADRDPQPISGPTSDDTDARIVSLSKSHGAAEIVAALKTDGISVTAQKVGAVLREHKKQAAESKV